MKRCIVWFRRDLRLYDNPALAAAIESGAEILPVYIHCEKQHSQLSEGGASKWWLHHALNDLNDQLLACGGRLYLVSGQDTANALTELVKEYQIDTVFWNRRYQSAAIELDKLLKKQLIEDGREVTSFNASLLNEPHEIANKSGKPYQVFTPYWKCCREKEVPEPVPVSLAKGRWSEASGCELDSLELLPEIKWDRGFYAEWHPTREGALKCMKRFLGEPAKEYNEERDMLAHDGTSRISPYLHFGQIGVREIYHMLRGGGDVVMNGYIRQLYWRDFAHHLIYHFPHSVTTCLRPEYDQFPWQRSDELLEKWQQGLTGYPVIDAAMRQLWKTGWMHNRARMVVGSFLVKHLLQDWQSGADWFWDTLIDADLPNNVMGWQWVGGCGADAAPYFRVFNPLLQGKKFDPLGEYVRKYVPELAKLPNSAIHAPWELSDAELAQCGVHLGENYPCRIIDLNEGRDRALGAYREFKALTNS